MNTQTRIRATSPAKGIVLSCVTICAALCMLLNIIPRTAGNLTMLTFCIILIIPGTLYHLLHAVYLTTEGAEFCRLGRVLRLIPWSQTEQVCLVRDFRRSAKGSDPARIIITPAGCPLYDASECSGLKYLMAHRRQVLWADNTPQNRNFIEAHCNQTTISRERL